MKSKAQQAKLYFDLLRLTLVLWTLLIGIGTAQAGTLTVNSNADSNVCNDFLTLREAMLIGAGGNALGRPLTTAERNQISGATFAAAPPPLNCSFTASYWSITSGVGADIQDNIVFSTSVTNILITSGLPNITWAEDIINGLKSDGTKAAIDGTAAGAVPGLRVIATVGFTIRNLIIKNFQYEGILVEGSDNGIYEGLEIFNNGRDGIALVYYLSPLANYNSANNRIGGITASQRNFIYSNGQNGISIITTPSAPHYPDQNNVIENNYIGLKDNNGNADFGNGWDGIYLEKAFGNRIGGDTAVSRNVISGNNENGIWIRGGGSYSNRIVNNFIGTNKDGNAVIGNTASGIAVSEGAGRRGGLTVQPNMIGDVGQGNVIAGNFYGIALYDSDTSENIIRGNFIGTDLTASFNLGNTSGGIAMGRDTHDNIIGGAANGDGNVIAYNNNPGIFMDNGYNNSIRRNRIFLNAALGIDLGTNGVTVNDPGDFDTGANNFQNYPLIGSGSSGGGFTNIGGSMSGTANTAFTLDFFISPDRDPSGYGEGSTYVGSTTVTTDNFGFASFNSSFNTVLNYSGFYATATATDPNGNTSEFSPATRIGCSYSLSPSSQNFGTAGGTGSFNLTTSAACDWQAVRSDSWITITGGASGTGNGTVSFSVAANTGPARTGTITVGGRIFTISQASNCTYSLVSNTAGHPASGGSDGNSVIAPAGCTWTTISNNPWIAVTSGSSSSGTASFTYSVAVNTGPARQGTLTVAGLTYFINQASGCTYQLSHFSAGYPVSGTNFDGVSITAGSGCVWTATSNANWITVTSGGSGTGSGSTTWSVAANPGAARQGTLTVAGSTFTINQAAAPRRAPFDFDGDGKTDIGVWRASSGSWWYLQSSDLSGYGHSFGLPDDIITPGDFTGDRKTDVAIWRPGTGEWFVRRSEDGSYFSYQFGLSGDIPAPADYDGDGITDTATFRPSTATWYIFQSSNGTFGIVTFGLNDDRPVPADYDGDGKADVAVWRPSNGSWWIVRSSDLQQRGYGFGLGTDRPVVGDYTGDGKADIAVWRDTTREWYFLRSEDGSYYSYPSGLPGDIPAPGDYDGDGRFDSAVFRPSTQTWYIDGSSAGSMIATFGLSGDRPVPNAFVP